MTVVERFGEWVLAAWNGQMSFNELLENAGALESQQQWPLVALLYQTWLKRNQSPFIHAGYFNLAAALTNAGDVVSAEAAYRYAMEIAPGFIQPRINLGSLYERTGAVDKALDEWRWVVEHVSGEQENDRPMLIMALNNLGRVLENQKIYDQAFEYLKRSANLDPSQQDVIHHIIYLRQKQCSWPVYGGVESLSRAQFFESTSALAMISITDDAEKQLNAAQSFVQRKIKSDVPALSDKKSYGHPKIRIGYCSSDFSLHPVSMLTVQMFELHDRNQFEVYGYCWSPEDGSGLRQRVIKAMDHFVRIKDMDDETAARRIRADEIDILIDLQGQTAGARPNMLAYRPAPIQITYLGLPATTGLPSIDYVIADKYLIPEDQAPYYSEKPIYMPDIYQVSDTQRVVAATPTRASCGLPEQGFVFCSFNNNSKFTPEMFGAWMRILSRVPGSVLWLLADNQWAEANLKKEAEQYDINPDRIIFAGRVLPEEYLARYRLVDLFLDTFPFNAGTTANDALWMGVPILTISGRAFASRMAGALLTAAGLPQLITQSMSEYVEKAVSLACNRDVLNAYRNKLISERDRLPIFDTPKFVRNLESRLCSLFPMP